VQLYAADTATGVTLPAQQLIGFARVDLEPGKSKTVSFTVPLSVLAYTGISGELVMEPGPIEVSAGSSSSDIRSTAKFNVTGKRRTIKVRTARSCRPRRSAPRRVGWASRFLLPPSPVWLYDLSVFATLSAERAAASRYLTR